MPAENGRRATAARLFLRARELLTTDGIQGQLLHSLHLSPHGTLCGWGCLRFLTDSRYRSRCTRRPAQDPIPVRFDPWIRWFEVATARAHKRLSLLSPCPRPPEQLLGTSTPSMASVALRSPSQLTSRCHSPGVPGLRRPNRVKNQPSRHLRPRQERRSPPLHLSLIHISEPTRRTPISYAVFCL